MNIIPPSFNFNKSLVSGSLVSGTSGTGSLGGPVEERINVLKGKGNVLIAELKDDELEVFDEVTNHIRQGKDTKSIDKFIKKEFIKKEDVLPGTVAAFFNDCYNTKHKGCSVECSGLAKKTDRKTCKDWVFVLEEGILKELHSSEAKHAYVYAKEALSKVAKDDLIKKGIKEVTLVTDEAERRISLLIADIEKKEESAIISGILFLLFLIILVVIGYMSYVYLKKNNMISPASITF